MMSVGLASAAHKARLDIMVDHGPPHLRPLYLALRDYGIGIMMVPQGPDFFDVPTDRPAAVIIGDDMDRALGPGAFHCKSLQRMIRLSSGGIIVASEPAVEAYALLATTTIATAALGGPRHAFLIETLPEQERAWLDFIHDVRPSVTVPTWTVRPKERGKRGPKVDYDRYQRIFDEVPG